MHHMDNTGEHLYYFGDLEEMLTDETRELIASSWTVVPHVTTPDDRIVVAAADHLKDMGV